MKQQKCPFKVGDRVRFTPSERTKGLYQNIERFGLKIGEEVTIHSIKGNIYLYFNDGRGGFPWNEFTEVKNKNRL